MPARGERATHLLERDQELATITSMVEDSSTGRGRLVLIEGPAGIGKTALLDQLERLALHTEHRVLSARGSGMEQEFGFGIVRQLFAPLLLSLPRDERERLLDGPAALAAPVFGLADHQSLEAHGAEPSFYGLHHLVVALTDRAPLVLAIDDAHWCDLASLRFAQYLGRRLSRLPVLVALVSRPGDPGAAAEMLRNVTTSLEIETINPAVLSETATAEIIHERLGGEVPTEVVAACHDATGGNPLLIGELLAQLGGRRRPISREQVVAMGPEQLALELSERAGLLGPHAVDVMRAVAVLGDRAELATVAALATVSRTEAGEILDGLVANSILRLEGGYGFVYPLLQSAVYHHIPRARRSALHGRAAELLAQRRATAEEVAAHLLRCDRGASSVDVTALLEAAGKDADQRGAPESVATYVRRALEEGHEPPRRAELLHRLGSAEVAVRDPQAVEHLREAARLTDDPRRALDIWLELADLLGQAGQWDATTQAVESALASCGNRELPGVLDLEAVRAVTRFYDPSRVRDYDRDLPRLRALIRGRSDEDSQQLRWVIAAADSARGAPVEGVLALLAPREDEWSVYRRGRESSLVAQALFTLLMTDAVEQGELLAESLREEARDRGSLMAIIFADCYQASLEARRGRLASSESALSSVMALVRENEMSLMALTTVLYFCLDTLIERERLAWLADLVLGLELPSPFAETCSGAMAMEVRGAVRLARGDRVGAVRDLAAAGEIHRPIKIGPRLSRWRSRLALALVGTDRARALELAGEELELARQMGSPYELGIALRACGLVTGGAAGADHLRESVAILSPAESPLELAHSMTALGAATRRGNDRVAAREQLREAARVAQACGAETLERRVGEELRIAGARPRRRALSGVESLTPAERRVVETAAGGATNSEIAQQLYVSLRTVEMHLTSAYRKLDVSSRKQLVGSLFAKE